MVSPSAYSTKIRPLVAVAVERGRGGGIANGHTNRAEVRIREAIERGKMNESGRRKP